MKIYEIASGFHAAQDRQRDADATKTAFANLIDLCPGANIPGFPRIAVYSLATSGTTRAVAFTRRRRKKNAKCLALHWRQRNGRRSNKSRMVHSKMPRRGDRKTTSL